MTIRTEYPYQSLDQVPKGAERPAYRLWAAYVPEDAEQRTCHAYGLLMIEKPRLPGALHLAWPLIRRFTESVFAEDRMAVEAEQRAWEEQGEDRNHGVFPLILDLREVLRANGVPIQPQASASSIARHVVAGRRRPATTPHRTAPGGHLSTRNPPLRRRAGERPSRRNRAELSTELAPASQDGAADGPPGL